MTNCGRVGWVSDRTATATLPTIPTPALRGRPCRRRSSTWRHALLPRRIRPLRSRRVPDQPLLTGAKLGLHQDRDENDPWSPIVSVSLGLPAVFLWGGKKPRRTRAPPARRKRRCRGVGRPGAVRLSRRRPAQGRRPPAHRRRPYQPYVQKSILIFNCLRSTNPQPEFPHSLFCASSDNI